MTDDEREALKRANAEHLDRLMRKLGERWPWLHPDFDRDSYLWREKARRAWNREGRWPHLY